MGLILPLFSVILFFIFFFLKTRSGGVYTKIRESFILSLITNGLLVFIYNEIFSAFDSLNSWSAITYWFSEVLFVSGLLFYQNSAGRINFKNLKLLKETARLQGWNTTSKVIFLIALSCFIVPLFFLAIFSPPNNYDAHSYHLNRILFWIYNENLNHYATEHAQQLYHNLFAEYLVLDFMLLSGLDSFVGLVQFGAFLGSLAGIGLLSKKFGLQASGQLLSTVFLMTLPIGIFESTSAQVDYVACFFFITFVYFGYDLLESKSSLVLLAFLLSLALGGFTKYTILIFAIPFTIYFGFQILQKYGILYAAKVLVLAAFLLLAVFSPFFYRNYSLFGNAVSPVEESRFFAEKIPVDKHSLLFAVSGVIKNAGLHIGLPSTAFNQALDQQIRKIHDLLGVDIDDPGLRIDRFSVRYSVHEDMVPNTFHFWLICGAGIILLFLKARWKLKWLWICAILGFVLFCSMLKFQLWSSRTHMPFFALGAVLVSCIFCQKFNWRPVFLTVPLMLFSSVFVIGNPNKSLVPLGYSIRKLIGHIPVAICEANLAEGALFRKNLADYYDFPGQNGCHPLKQWPDYQTRTKIFSILDDLGYNDDDRSGTVFSTDRTKAYFSSHMDDYYAFKPLLEHINGDHKNIGVLFAKGNGFYHYASAVATKIGQPGQMQYIRYKKEFMSLDNAQKPFCYDYILCDDIHLLNEFSKKVQVEKVYQTSLLYLVKLKRTSCERELY